MTDTLEREAKIAVDNLDALEAKLDALGAERIGRWRETDTFFDSDDRRLKSADSALRLRQRVDLADTAKTWFRLTFKGPKQPGRFKNRREIETAVDAPHTTRSLLEALGLNAFITYTKHRTTFRYRECTIELDDLPDIGTFIEVEGPDEPAITTVLSDLNLTDHPTITDSYLAMVLNHRANNPS